MLLALSSSGGSINFRVGLKRFDKALLNSHYTRFTNNLFKGLEGTLPARAYVELTRIIPLYVTCKHSPRFVVSCSIRSLSIDLFERFAARKITCFGIYLHLIIFGWVNATEIVLRCGLLQGPCWLINLQNSLYFQISPALAIILSLLGNICSVNLLSKLSPLSRFRDEFTASENKRGSHYVNFS